MSRWQTPPNASSSPGNRGIVGTTKTITVRLIKLAGSLLVRLLDLLTGLIRRGLGMRAAGACVVLYYHVVTQEQRKLFAEQLDWLGKRCKLIAIDKLAELEPGIHHAVITFDDGFKSVIQNALPELEARDIPVTIFVPSGWLGQSPRWPGVVEALKAHEMVLDERQLKEMKQRPLISIGSHCISHPFLLDLDERQARNEILGSRLQLEKILKEEIQVLSFPFGAFSETHVKWARESGYRFVFTTSPELITEDDPGKYVVGRVAADPSDWPLEFRLKALGAYRWLPLAFSLKRTLRGFWSNIPRGATGTE